jgi:rod shape-determining protein MreC
MQHSPPPLFKQGASARVKVVFFTIFSIALLIVDSRMNSLVNVRRLVATVIYPIQLLAVAPRDIVYGIGNYFSSSARLQAELDQLRTKQIKNADSLSKNTFLTTENDQLRRLLLIKERTASKSLLAEVIYEVHDFSSRKVFLNKGLQHGIELGQPVIDDRGVVGQVTRVFPLTAEVTLITDKSHAIPVQIARNGLRSVLHGKGQFSNMEMSMTTNADVVMGDVLVTSGLDGIYPEGLQVAKVVKVENKASTTFENILCEPTAGVNQHQQLLVLLVSTKDVGMPESEEVRNTKEKINRKVTRDSNNDTSAEEKNETKNKLMNEAQTETVQSKNEAQDINAELKEKTDNKNTPNLPKEVKK